MSSSHKVHSLSQDEVRIPANHWAAKAPMIFGVIGVICLAAAIGIGMADTKDLHFSFHVSFMYFLSIALGGLFFVIIQHAAAAGWSAVLRRMAEAVMSSLPLFLILFVSVVLGMHSLFHHWTDTEAVLKDKILVQKMAYLNEPFFFVRAAIYFVLWLVMARFFFKNSTLQDASGDHALTRKMRKFSYPCIAAFALTLTFAVFDWVMSIDPHWYSTMFGVYFFAGSAISIYAFLIVLTSVFRGVDRIGNAITTEHQHDLGKLMFGHTAFWAYVTFCQYFLIWYANIPEETLWYYHRSHHGWMGMGIALMVGHFVLPFWFLISRTVKRSKVFVTCGALWMLMVHFFDIFYMIMPSGREHFAIAPTDVLSFLGIGGLFLAWIFAALKKHGLIAVKDPLINESLAFENY